MTKTALNRQKNVCYRLKKTHDTKCLITRHCCHFSCFYVKFSFDVGSVFCVDFLSHLVQTRFLHLEITTKATVFFFSRCFFFHQSTNSTKNCFRKDWNWSYCMRIVVYFCIKKYALSNSSRYTRGGGQFLVPGFGKVTLLGTEMRCWILFDTRAKCLFS